MRILGRKGIIVRTKTLEIWGGREEKIVTGLERCWYGDYINFISKTLNINHFLMSHTYVF